MKNLFFSISLLSISLFLFSFSSSDTNVSSYEEISENTLYDASETELGEFSEFENTRYTSDKTEWNHRRKTWTDFSKVADLNSIQEAIYNN